MELLELSTLAWIAIGTSALLVGLSKAGFGAGAGILAVPLMTIGLGSAQDMLPVLLPVLIAGDVFSLIHYPGQKNWRNLAMLVPGCLLGVGLGWLALHWLGDLSQLQVGSSSLTGEAMLQKFVGGICVLFVVIQLWRYFRESRLTERAEPFRPKAWQGVGLGSAAGLTSTLAHAAGPLVALFLLPQKLDKRVFVGTTVTYFFFGNLIKFIPFTAQGLFTTPRVMTSLILVPAVVAGTLIGVVLNRKIDDRVFVLIIYGVALVAGLNLLVG
jgi:hypothetical protein